MSTSTVTCCGSGSVTTSSKPPQNQHRRGTKQEGLPHPRPGLTTIRMSRINRHRSVNHHPKTNSPTREAFSRSVFVTCRLFIAYGVIKEVAHSVFRNARRVRSVADVVDYCRAIRPRNDRPRAVGLVLQIAAPAFVSTAWWCSRSSRGGSKSACATGNCAALGSASPGQQPR